MFFSRRKNEENESLLKISESMHPVIQVKAGSDLDKQLKMLNLTKEDFAVAQVLRQFVEEKTFPIIDGFYKNLEHNPNLIKIIEKNSSIERLKKTLRRHIIEMFSGEMNEAFIQRRKKIALVHVKIGLTQKWYIASFEMIFEGLVNLVEKHFENENDRMLAIKVINKLLNLEQQVVLEAYDDEVARQNELAAQSKLDVMHKLDQTSNELATMSQETNASIEEMTAQIEAITKKSQTGTALAEKTMTASNQGSSQLHLMDKSIHHTQDSVTEVNKNMAELELMSSEIINITEIVKSIAGQTNLLALNASIEAARAGEHGLGFSVVAEEIRKLSDETRKAVENVTDLVNQTNDQIFNSSASLEKVQTFLTDSKDQMNKTKAIFQEINEAMDKTKISNIETQDELEILSEVIYDIGQAAATITETAEELQALFDETID